MIGDELDGGVCYELGDESFLLKQAPQRQTTQGEDGGEGCYKHMISVGSVSSPMSIADLRKKGGASTAQAADPATTGDYTTAKNSQRPLSEYVRFETKEGMAFFSIQAVWTSGLARTTSGTASASATSTRARGKYCHQRRVKTFAAISSDIRRESKRGSKQTSLSSWLASATRRWKKSSESTSADSRGRFVPCLPAENKSTKKSWRTSGTGNTGHPDCRAAPRQKRQSQEGQGQEEAEGQEGGEEGKEAKEDSQEGQARHGGCGGPQQDQ